MTVLEIASSDIAKVWEKENLGLFLQPQLATLVGPGMLFLKVKVSHEAEVYFSCYTYKSWGFRFIINPPGMAYCGFRMVNSPADEAACQVLKSEALKSLASYLLKVYPSATFDLRLEPSVLEFDGLPGFEVDNVSHNSLDITLPETDLFAQLSSRRKRNIKKQLKGYEMDNNPNIDEVLTLLDYTFAKSETENLQPFYKEGLVGELSFMKSNIVSLEGQSLATNVVAYDAGVAYYLLGGIDPVKNDANAGTIAMWNAILEAKKAGIKSFNFCGSSIPSISEYFKSFGAGELKITRLRKGNQLVQKLKKLKGKR